MPNYPEHEKLKALQGKNDVVGDFINWLYENNWQIARRHEHMDSCGEADKSFPYMHQCGYVTGEMFRDRRSIETIIAEFFDIDAQRLSEEKDQMVREIQEQRT